MRVGLFATCLVDGMFPDAGKATIRLLRRLGHSVELPLQQTCCGPAGRTSCPSSSWTCSA